MSVTWYEDSVARVHEVGGAGGRFPARVSTIPSP